MKKVIIAVTIAAALCTASFANAQKAAKTTPKVKKEATMQKADVASKQKAPVKLAAAEKKSETKGKQKAK